MCIVRNFIGICIVHIFISIRKVIIFVLCMLRIFMTTCKLRAPVLPVHFLTSLPSWYRMRSQRQDYRVLRMW